MKVFLNALTMTGIHIQYSNISYIKPAEHTGCSGLMCQNSTPQNTTKNKKMYF